MWLTAPTSELNGKTNRALADVFGHDLFLSEKWPKALLANCPSRTVLDIAWLEDCMANPATKNGHRIKTTSKIFLVVVTGMTAEVVQKSDAE